MELIVKSRNLEVTDYLRQYVEKKIGKLDRYLPSLIDARVELASEDTKTAGEVYIAQVTLRTDKTILRSEERTGDIFASVDAVLDKLYRQIVRYKGRRQDRFRGRTETPPIAAEEVEELEEGETGRIVRRKRFQALPMDELEAIEQMELLGHDFFVFNHAQTGQIAVVYRRKDGNYGLIEPELA